MSDRESLLGMGVQGLGLNLSGLALLVAAGTAFGPLSWTGVVAVMLKLIGDSQLLCGYWHWQSRRQEGEGELLQAEAEN